MFCFQNSTSCNAWLLNVQLHYCDVPFCLQPAETLKATCIGNNPKTTISIPSETTYTITSTTQLDVWFQERIERQRKMISGGFPPPSSSGSSNSAPKLEHDGFLQSCRNEKHTYHLNPEFSLAAKPGLHADESLSSMHAPADVKADMHGTEGQSGTAKEGIMKATIEESLRQPQGGGNEGPAAAAQVAAPEIEPSRMMMQKGVCAEGTAIAQTEIYMREIGKQLDRFKKHHRFLDQYELLGMGARRKGGALSLRFILL